jgi:hypothetical protein
MPIQSLHEDECKAKGKPEEAARFMERVLEARGDADFKLHPTYYFSFVKQCANRPDLAHAHDQLNRLRDAGLFKDNK